MTPAIKDIDLPPDSDFAQTLQYFMARAERRDIDLARLTGISARTIEKWRRGEVQRPRQIADLLKLAWVLNLDRAETSGLLRLAGHLPLDTLFQQVQQATAHPLRELVSVWFEAREPEATAARAAEQPLCLCYQLRAPIADFVGRTGLVPQLIAAFQAEQGACISGILGMGGIGKTELAYYVAHQLTPRFPDAQIVVGLHGSSATPRSAVHAMQEIIRVFIPDAKLPDDPLALQQLYCGALHGRRVLILADDACNAAQVQPLIPPLGCGLLITSRMRFTLPGMTTIDLDPLDEAEAVGLLCSICSRLSQTEAGLIARACGQLPLALRVSGAILHNNPALAINDYIDRIADIRQRLQQLHDPDDPQLDVAASLSLSYTMMDPTTQQAFRQLGVLAADFAASLAHAVLAPAQEIDGEQILYLLLRRNLLMYDARLERWRLHDLVRAMALHQLECAGELEATTWRYARAVVHLTSQIDQQVQAGGASLLTGLAQFDAERPHIDQTRHWALAHAGTPEGDALLVEYALAACYIEHLRYDTLSERMPLLEQTLAAARRMGDRRGEGVVLNGLGFACNDLGDIRRSICYLEQNLAIVRAIADREGELDALNNLGLAYVDLGEPQRAVVYYEQVYEIIHAIEHTHDEGVILCNLGRASIDLGDLQQAVRYFERARTVTQEQGDRRTEAFTLIGLGRASIALNDPRRAVELCLQAQEIAREMSYDRCEGYALSVLGRAYALLGHDVCASATMEQGLAILQSVGDRWGTAECSWHLGLILFAQGARARALPLLHSCVSYEEEIGHMRAVEHRALLARLDACEEREAQPLSYGSLSG